MLFSGEQPQGAAALGHGPVCVWLTPCEAMCRLPPQNCASQSTTQGYGVVVLLSTHVVLPLCFPVCPRSHYPQVGQEAGEDLPERPRDGGPGGGGQLRQDCRVHHRAGGAGAHGHQEPLLLLLAFSTDAASLLLARFSASILLSSRQACLFVRRTAGLAECAELGCWRPLCELLGCLADCSCGAVLGTGDRRDAAQRPGGPAHCVRCRGQGHCVHPDQARGGRGRRIR